MNDECKTSELMASIDKYDLESHNIEDIQITGCIKDSLYTETDIMTLLECLKCQHDNPKALCRTLLTLSSLFTDNEEAKDVFRKENGIQFVFKLMTKASTPELKHSIMFCLACAVDKNVSSQSVVSKREIFDYIHHVLKVTGNNNEKIQQTAIFLLLCIVASNSVGQKLASESLCLDDLILLFRRLLDRLANWNSNYKGLWCSLNSALSMCVNNPQNDSNQRKCCILFPQALKCLSESSDPDILRPVLAFLGLTVANNVCNQDRVRRCGGIDILISQLKIWIQLVHTDCDYLSLAVSGVGTLDSCISDNEENCKEMLELNGSGVLFLLINHEELDNTEKLQIILTLGHCLDVNSDYRYVLKTREKNILIHILTQTQEEELMKAIKYVLQIGNKGSSSITEKGIKDKTANDPSLLILQKITDLSNKLDCMDTEIKSKQSEELDIDYWMNTNNNNRCIDTSINKSFEIPRHVQPTKDDKIFTKFANFLRSSHNNSKEDDSSKDESKNLLKQATSYSFLRQSPVFDTQRNLSLSYFKSPVENWPSHINDSTHQGIPDEGSYNYRNNSTALAGCCQDHDQIQHTLQQGTKHEDQRISVHNEHRCHSTPKENRYEESTHHKLQLAQNLHPELFEIASESQIYNEPSDVDRSHISSINMSTQTQSRITTDSVQNEPEICYHAPKTKVLQKANITTISTQTEANEDLLISLQSNQKPTANDNNAVMKDTSSQTYEGNEDQCMIKNGNSIKIRKNRSKIFSKDINSNDDFFDGFSLMDLFDGPKETSEAVKQQTGKSLTKNARRQYPMNKGPETFVKPNAPPIRRRVRHTPSLGSCVISRPLKETLQNVKEMEEETEQRSPHERIIPFSCTSPALSEFDFSLVQKAKTGKYGPPRKSERLELVESQQSSPETSSSTLSKFSTEPEIEGDCCDDEHINTITDAKSIKQHQLEKKCPGCQPSGKGVFPNSRTYNIILESSQYICHYHRELRQLERDYIHSITSEFRKPRSHPLTQSVEESQDKVKDKKKVYDFSSSDSGSNTISPPQSSNSLTDVCRRNIYENRPKRRERIDYTDDEIANLLDGVDTMGRCWNQILVTYNFHSSRTAVDLQEKYKRMQKTDKKKKQRREPKPFSMCEERRLNRGIQVLGYNWKGILNSYKFSNGRTAEDLRNKWKNLNKLYNSNN